jgi:L-amino acid N-acyltransferase YncA
MQPPEYSAILESPRFRRRGVDKLGEPFGVRPADIRDLEAVLDMFEDFEPKEGFLGLPPADPGRCRDWVRLGVGDRVNLVAEAGGKVVGHGCLIDMEPGVRAELVVMVHQTRRNRGIGSCLMEVLIDLARALGYQIIWMVVERQNSRAIRVFRRKGFRMIGPLDLEIELELEL